MTHAVNRANDSMGGSRRQCLERGPEGASITNWDRIAQLMDAAEADVLIASTPENVLYLTSFYSLSHWLIASTESYAVMARSNLYRPSLVFPKSDVDLVVESNAQTLPLYPYGDFFVIPSKEYQGPPADEATLDGIMGNVSHDSAASALSAALRDLPSSPSKISVDSRGLSGAAREAVVQYARLNNARLAEDGDSILIGARMVKTDEEVRRLSFAAHVTEEAIQFVLDDIVEGRTELEAKRVFQEFLVKHDVEPRVSVLGFGGHSAFPNGLPGTRRLEPGEIIRFDVGGVFRNYWSDLARVAVLGEPTERTKKYYRALLLGEDACLAAARPGNTAGDVFDATMRVVRSEGIPEYRRQHVGHGIGLNIYDPPILRRGDNTILEPGMVLCIETPFYEVGFGGLQVEDLIVVTEAGSRMVTASSRELRHV